MLVEKTLFGTEDKIATALERIKYFEPKDGNGFYVAFSGGKDSIVIKDLVVKSGVKYDIHFNFTTVDPPELVKFINDYHKDVQVHRPKESMFQLIVRKRLLPTRMIRYCCEILKEYGGQDRVQITGVRWTESPKRKQRRLFETCRRDGTKRFLHPIIDWSDDEVWEYIRQEKLPYCKLYDEGFTRIGCIGCPMVNQKGEFERWPKFEKAYKFAIKKMIEKNKKDYETGIYKPKNGPKCLGLSDVETVWEWWLRKNQQEPNQDSQCLLFE